jgi:hypothetical protein
MSTYADYDHESYDVAVFSLLSLNILLNSGIIFWFVKLFCRDWKLISNHHSLGSSSITNATPTVTFNG